MKGFWWYAVGAAILVLVLVLVFTSFDRQILLGPDDGTTSTRSFEGDLMGKPVTVNMDVDYDSGDGTPFIDIIQFIPDGFNLEYEGISVPRSDLEPYASYPSIPIQFLDFDPAAAGTLSYVITPDPSVLCPGAPGTSIPIDTLYLAPPQEPRPERGAASLDIAERNVIRAFSKSEVNVDGELVVYMHVYPACYDSYQVADFPGWTILDTGGGVETMGTIIWEVNCPGVCESTILSYKILAPSSTWSGDFIGQFRIPAGDSLEMLPYDRVLVRDLNCVVGGACASEDACQGEYCNVGQTQSCFGFSCVDACMGRDGYYCGTGCQPEDIAYPAGDLACGGDICCQDMPTQTCEEVGGYCVLDDVAPMQECPPGFSSDTSRDITCNGLEIPLAGAPYPICCMPPA